MQIIGAFKQTPKVLSWIKVNVKQNQKKVQCKPWRHSYQSYNVWHQYLLFCFSSTLPLLFTQNSKHNNRYLPGSSSCQRRQLKSWWLDDIGNIYHAYLQMTNLSIERLHELPKPVQSGPAQAATRPCHCGTAQPGAPSWQCFRWTACEPLEGRVVVHPFSAEVSQVAFPSGPRRKLHCRSSFEGCRTMTSEVKWTVQCSCHGQS